MDDIETIRGLAVKLLALSDPARGGTAAECATAKAKLQKLLDRSGLTVRDLENEQVEPFGFEVRSEDETRLLVQCLAFILNQPQIALLRLPKTRLVQTKTKRGKVKKLLQSYTVIEVELTRVQAADAKACFTHYSEIMEEQREALESKLKIYRRALKSLPTAIASKYNLFSEQVEGGGSDKPLSPAQIAAIIAAMSGLDGDAWQRADGLQVELLLNERGAA